MRKEKITIKGKLVNILVDEGWNHNENRLILSVLDEKTGTVELLSKKVSTLLESFFYIITI